MVAEKNEKIQTTNQQTVMFLCRRFGDRQTDGQTDSAKA